MYIGGHLKPLSRLVIYCIRWSCQSKDLDEGPWSPNINQYMSKIERELTWNAWLLQSRNLEIDRQIKTNINRGRTKVTYLILFAFKGIFLFWLRKILSNVLKSRNKTEREKATLTRAVYHVQVERNLLSSLDRFKNPLRCNDLHVDEMRVRKKQTDLQQE
jgi:hypothetical protein